MLKEIKSSRNKTCQIEVEKQIQKRQEIVQIEKDNTINKEKRTLDNLAMQIEMDNEFERQKKQDQKDHFKEIWTVQKEIANKGASAEKKF